MFAFLHHSLPMCERCDRLIPGISITAANQPTSARRIEPHKKGLSFCIQSEGVKTIQDSGDSKPIVIRVGPNLCTSFREGSSLHYRAVRVRIQPDKREESNERLPQSALQLLIAPERFNVFVCQ